MMKTFKRGSRQRAGFTLVDTILMMLVVGIGVTGLMTYFISINRQTGNANNTIAAAVLAQERVDQVIADKMYRGYNWIVAASYPNENLTGDFAGYTRTTQIREVNSADLTTNLPGSGLKRIDITVIWGAAAAERVVLTTLVTQY